MATTTNFGWETPDDTDLVKDGAAAMRTLGSSIDTSFVDLKGGTTGQVLAKASNTDLDYSWVTTDDTNAIQNAIVDAKGDLIAASAADTPARLAVGTNGQFLSADSTTATGLAWAAAPSPSYTWTTFTPTLKQGSTTFTVAANSGKWMKIGNLVHVIISTNISSGTGTSNSAITFVTPVEASAFTSGYPTGGAAAIYDASANLNYPSLLCMNSSTDLTFWGTTTNTAFKNMGETGSPLAAQLTSSDNVSLNIVYPWA